MRFSKQITVIVFTCVSAPLIVGPAWGQFAGDERFPGPSASLIAQAQPPPPAINGPAEAPAAGAKTEEGVEVLASGPIHEAFAGPLVLDPKPGVIAKKEPPRPVEELPPEQRPEGNDIEWITGYWHWDDERNDYIWVSGIWREIPQGRRWVVGYWAKVDDGWQRTSGFWTAAEEKEVAYVEEAPPATIEAGPNIPAPSENHFWVPGCWAYQDVRYVWRPGFWHVAYPDWVWCPSHWNWTPCGYVYTTGYWDYVFARRGICYSPVYYHSPIYTHADYHWTPSLCFGFGALSLHLFARPHYGHYYCGDYYGSHWAGHGFHAWFDFHHHHRHYDPHFVHARWYHHQHRGERNWEANLAARHRHFENNVAARPARTFSEQIVRRDRGVSPADAIVAQRIGDLRRDPQTPVKFANLDRKTRDDIAQGSRRWREFQRDRATVEAGNRLPANRIVDATRQPGDRTRPDRKTPDATSPDVKLPDVAGAARGTRERPKFKLPENSPGVSKRPAVGAIAGDAQRTRPDRGDRQPRPRPGDNPADKLPTTRQPRPTPSDRPDIARPGTNRPDVNRPNLDRPNIDRDRPRVDRPQPKVDRPQPKVDRPQPKIDRGPTPDPRPRPDNSPPRIEGSRRPPRIDTPPPSGGDRTPRRAPERPPERPDRGRANQAGANIDRPIPQRPPVERAAPPPRVDRPAPQPRIERPAPPPRVDRPAPRVERPAPPPRVDRPAPRVERPAPPPRVERPAPRIDRPAPRIERPAPQRSAPVQRAAPSRPPSPPPAARSAPPRQAPPAPRNDNRDRRNRRDK